LNTMSSNKILLVEDNTSVLRTMQRIIENDGFSVVCATTLREVETILAQGEHHFMACVLDYCLPDASNGETLPIVLARKIPTIVLTARSDMETREKVLLQAVVDYVPKDTPAAFEYTIKMIRRIHHNPGIRVLVVDDSVTIRSSATCASCCAATCTRCWKHRKPIPRYACCATTRPSAWCCPTTTCRARTA